ncbi:MAG TPA: dockerin type I repeat-containing protein, partial [Lacipirellulaceae bacterium]|nr:dockerin type I repeat-containing protein [Lacipirellulaceae bacterium]
AQRVVFDAGYTVSGIGSFTNVLFNGTFAPGLSPGVVAGSDLSIGGTLAIELGGATPGNGPGHHDQVVDAGEFALVDGARLALQSFGGYRPAPGQRFEIVKSSGGVTGSFAGVDVDPWFIAQGIGFALDAQPTSLSATAVAVSGDFNGDGLVNGADLLLWQRDLGTAGPSLADGDGNGVVDAGDLAIWQIQFAAAHGAAFAAGGAVPEPAAWALTLTSVALLRRRSPRSLR